MDGGQYVKCLDNMQCRTLIFDLPFLTAVIAWSRLGRVGAIGLGVTG